MKRTVALLASTVLAATALAGCSSDKVVEEESEPVDVVTEEETPEGEEVEVDEGEVTEEVTEDKE